MGQQGVLFMRQGANTMTHRNVAILIGALGIAGCTASASPSTSTSSGASSAAAVPVTHDAASARLADSEAVSRVREVTLPAGTLLRLRLSSAVSSRTSSVEDPV